VMFLKPNGWNELTRGDFSDSAYGASPETFTLTKNFETGLTIQIARATNARKGIPASHAAMAMMKSIVKTHKEEEILSLSEKESGAVKTYIIRYRDAPPGLTPIVVHKFFTADDSNDILHIFTFESPESSWDASWNSFGTPILSRIRYIGVGRR